jgi:hypothetical protein|tara:strand:- start:77 stop:292 length:216 start_codon:yes stop_codon:yes gene_type:complete
MIVDYAHVRTSEEKRMQKEKFPNRQLFLLFSTKERNKKEKVPIQCHKYNALLHARGHRTHARDRLVDKIDD